jgi:hypothetical protein
MYLSSGGRQRDPKEHVCKTSVVLDGGHREKKETSKRLLSIAMSTVLALIFYRFLHSDEKFHVFFSISVFAFVRSCLSSVYVLFAMHKKKMHASYTAHTHKQR